MTLLSQTSPALPRASFSGRVCVSVFGRTVEELRRNVKRALAFQPGFIELRLDYVAGFSEKITQVKGISEFPNLIYTFRSRSEGGVSKVSTKMRRKILGEMMLRISPPIMDVELRTLEEFPELVDLLERRDHETKLVVSSHNFEGTDSASKLEELVVRASERFSPDYIKVVRTANDFQDNLTMLSLYNLATKIAPARLISFCAGPLGLFSRIACVSCGSPFTFASLPGKKTAPGQLDARSMTILMESWKSGAR